jgi:hypothetical protein
MAPSALEKLVSERDAVADILEFSDIQVKTNSTVPLDSTTVNTLIEELSSCRSKLTDIHTKIRALIPVDIELQKKIIIFYFSLVSQSITLFMESKQTCLPPPPLLHLQFQIILT